MAQSVATLFSRLQPDAWRAQTGFSQEVNATNERMFRAGVKKKQLIEAANGWIEKHQPCLFGRIAAKQDLLSYCLLGEADLHGPDEGIRAKIQAARTKWKRQGFRGQKSGFVILVVSPTIANAVPNGDMKELARRICCLYLLMEVEMDRIHLDDVILEKPGPRRSSWRWRAGVNYFCAQGDKRWWQDHRIPGGMAFSVNSVGHMVKSGMVARAMKNLEQLMGAPEEGWALPKVDSLEKALEFAMRTIYLASEATSGKATELLPLSAGSSGLPCPVALPDFLKEKNYCSYKGYYHTDYTLPSEFFIPDVERPLNVKSHMLDFTYLFSRHLDNPDFITTGEGEQIRVAKPVRRRPVTAHQGGPAPKTLIGNEESLSADETARWLKRLL